MYLPLCSSSDEFMHFCVNILKTLTTLTFYIVMPLPGTLIKSDLHFIRGIFLSLNQTNDSGLLARCSTIWAFWILIHVCYLAVSKISSWKVMLTYSPFYEISALRDVSTVILPLQLSSKSSFVVCYNECRSRDWISYY